jgi:hypothetical protein
VSDEIGSAEVRSEAEVIVTEEAMAAHPSVPDRIHALASLFAQRNAIYENSWHEIGPVMAAYFPRGLTLSTPEDFGRFMIVCMLIGKLHRYILNFGRGGHVDSLDDLSVYGQMLQELDDYINKMKGE